jgi:hypothetical protein
MNLEEQEVDAWLYFDGPEPAPLQPALDVLRDLPAATGDDCDRAVRRFVATLEATRSGRPAPPREQAASATLSTPPHEPASLRPGAMRLGTTEAADPPSPSLPTPPLAPPAPALMSTPLPASMRGPHRLAITSPALELPPEVRALQAATPFVHPSAVRNRAAKTLRALQMPAKLGTTAPLDEARMATLRETLPFNASTVGTGTIPFPRMSLEQYASLEADLAGGRATREAVLADYRVLHEAALGALRADWEARLASSPEERGRYAGMLAEFTAWVRTRGE